METLPASITHKAMKEGIPSLLPQTLPVEWIRKMIKGLRLQEEEKEGHSAAMMMVLLFHSRKDLPFTNKFEISEEMLHDKLAMLQIELLLELAHRKAMLAFNAPDAENFLTQRSINSTLPIEELQLKLKMILD